MKDTLNGIWVICCGIIVVIALCMPDKGNKKSDTTYDGRQSLTQQLRDPDSLQIIKEEIVDGHYRGILCLTTKSILNPM